MALSTVQEIKLKTLKQRIQLQAELYLAPRLQQLDFGSGDYWDRLGLQIEHQTAEFNQTRQAMAQILSEPETVEIVKTAMKAAIEKVYVATASQLNVELNAATRVTLEAKLKLLEEIALEFGIE